VEDIHCKFKDLGVMISIKVYYLFSHSDHFPTNDSDLSKEHVWYKVPPGHGKEVPGQLGCPHDGWVLSETESSTWMCGYGPVTSQKVLQKKIF